MGTFYDVDLRNASLRDFAFGVPWYLMPLVALLKLLRAPFPGTTDDPPVESLAPFEVEESALPEEIRAKMQPLAQELAALGFHSPIYHAIIYPLHATRTYWTSFPRSDGRVWARIQCRIFSGNARPRTLLFPMFFTAFADGSFFVSSAGKQDMLMPAGVRMVNQVGANAADLWQRHSAELATELFPPVLPVGSHDDMRAAMERHHVRLRDFNLERRVFKPLTDRQQQQLRGDLSPTTESSGEALETAMAPALRSEDAAVLLELERLETKRANWGNTLLILVISLGLFVAAAQFGENRSFMWLLIPILLFHELGHYLAMRWFGYRNLRMFFIPFLGAAVAGRHYNVAGWKKVVVALMGPMPGTVAAAGLGFAGWRFEQPLLAEAALLMAILNGFNLLPVLPLDGGWVVHAILFARHPLFDALSRLFAVVALVAIGTLAGDKFLLALPVLMLIALPASWRVAKTAHRLRKQGVVAVSQDAQTIPQDAALVILHEVPGVFPKHGTARMLAQHVASVFETLNARPPGVIASAVLLTVHLVSFVVAIILVGLLALAQHGDLMETAALVAHRPDYVYEPGATELRRGERALSPAAVERVTIIATFASSKEAVDAFAAATPDLPASATLRWLGQSLLLTLPGSEIAQQKVWTARWQNQAKRVDTNGKDSVVVVRLFCVAPNRQEAIRLQVELAAYLHAPNSQLLLPPWSAAWSALPAADQQRFGKARNTLFRLQNLYTEASKLPAIQALRKQMTSAMRDRDLKKMVELSKAVSQATKVESQRLLANLRTENETTVDHELLALWEQLSKLDQRVFGVDPPNPEDFRKPENNEPAKAALDAVEKERTVLLRRMADRMGCLPLDGAKPKSGSDLEAAHGAFVQCKGVYLAIGFLSFRDPDTGLPALLEWLGNRGCLHLRYGFDEREQDDAEGRNDNPP